MNLHNLDFEKLTKENRYGNVPKSIIYHDEKFYYKIIHDIDPYFRTSMAYYVIDGLDFLWSGNETMTINKVGLLDDEICPAFYDFIFDNNICCGYITHRGTSIVSNNNLTNIAYLKFVKTLVDKSIKQNWGYCGICEDNVIMYNGRPSLIDLDFSPIKLNHNKSLSEVEIQLWENEFRSDKDLYLNMLKTAMSKS